MIFSLGSSSSPVEGILSITGNTQTKLKTNLLHSQIENLRFLKLNRWIKRIFFFMHYNFNKNLYDYQFLLKILIEKFRNFREKNFVKFISKDENFENFVFRTFRSLGI